MVSSASHDYDRGPYGFKSDYRGGQDRVKHLRPATFDQPGCWPVLASFTQDSHRSAATAAQRQPLLRRGLERWRV